MSVDSRIVCIFYDDDVVLQYGRCAHFRAQAKV